MLRKKVKTWFSNKWPRFVRSAERRVRVNWFGHSDYSIDDFYIIVDLIDLLEAATAVDTYETDMYQPETETPIHETVEAVDNTDNDGHYNSPLNDTPDVAPDVTSPRAHVPVYSYETDNSPAESSRSSGYSDSSSGSTDYSSSYSGSSSSSDYSSSSSSSSYDSGSSSYD